MSERKIPTPVRTGNATHGPAAETGAGGLLQEGVERVLDVGRAGVASVREFGADIGLRNAEDLGQAARGAAKLTWEWVRANPLKSAAIAGAAAAWLLLRARR